MKSMSISGIARTAFACFAVLVGIIFYINTFDLPRAGYELPRLIIYLICILSFLVVLETFTISKKWKKDIAEVPDEEKNEKLLIKEKAVKDLFDDSNIKSAHYGRVSVAVLLIGAYIFLIEPVGYYICTPLFVIAAYALLRATRWPYVLAIAFGFTAFVYFVFVSFLNLPVPMGILG